MCLCARILRRRSSIVAHCGACISNMRSLGFVLRYCTQSSMRAPDLGVPLWLTLPFSPICGAGSSSAGKVFGIPLRESLRYANVPISTACGKDGVLYIYGYVPVVVAKWCVLPFTLSIAALISTLAVYISRRTVRIHSHISSFHAL